MESRLTLRGLFSGMAIAIVLVFLLLVIYFKSVIDPLIVLMAVPFALSGAMWMLFITQTHISVPALMGTIISMALGGAFFLRQQPQGSGRNAACGGSIDQRARTLRVEADIPNPDLKLLPGMYLRIEFKLKSKKFVQIPASALLFRTNGRSNRPRQW
jgi:hypothetical protein